MPKAISAELDKYEMEVVAIWNTALVTEVYLMSAEPDSSEAETFEMLSQSFLQSDLPEMDTI